MKNNLLNVTKTNNHIKHLNIFIRKISLPAKIWGENKHFPASVKEWPDSVYSYNKSYLKQTFYKRNIINNLINDYFNLQDKSLLAKSRKKRMLIKRTSLNRVTVSKPFIKHNNDKILINLFAYDKTNKSNIRNLYINNSNLTFYNNWLKKHFFSNKNIHTNKFINKSYKLNNNINYINNNISSHVNNYNFHRKKEIIHNYNNMFKQFYNINKLQGISFNKFKYLNLIRNLNKIKFPYKGLPYKLRNEKNLMLFRSVDMKKNNIKYIQKLFIYYFLICLLNIFNINVNIYKSKKHNKITMLCINDNKLIGTYNFNIKSIKNVIDTFILDKINFLLWSLLNKIIVKSNIIDFNKKLSTLFKYFYYNFYNRIFIKIINNNIINNINYFRLLISTYKYGNFLNHLKHIIYNIYNKKVDINVVKLKYPQLNSDIITSIMTRSLRRKKNFYTKIIGKSMSLTKLPLKILTNLSNNNNNLYKLDYYNTTSIKNRYSNIINKIIRNIYDSYDNNEKVNNILNTIKYKWITGIRIETTGRLSKRNTASKSLFKYKYKGNLRNIDYTVKDGITKPMSSILLRNYVKSNSQYTNDYSKKRIGSFSIKSWISSY